MKKDYISPLLLLFHPTSEEIISVSGEYPYFGIKDDTAEDIFT